ncbi:hypothetical protein C7S16_0106 [Burkholderia thailandensis]|uniref:Uncharacterized protein n=1 Tax=Burkholderia thailandensis TaxID=57975 RepID=A0AAW9CWB5_BURTH|nr:hypothetical protein [Burkholderia thailandensis]
MSRRASRAPSCMSRAPHGVTITRQTPCPHGTTDTPASARGTCRRPSPAPRHSSSWRTGAAREPLLVARGAQRAPPASGISACPV